MKQRSEVTLRRKPNTMQQAFLRAAQFSTTFRILKPNHTPWAFNGTVPSRNIIYFSDVFLILTFTFLFLTAKVLDNA
jgi:hypothetical protein